MSHPGSSTHGRRPKPRRIKPNTRFTFQPQILGRALRPWQHQPESNQSSQTLFSRATIRFVAFSLQTLCWAIQPAQTTPCYEFIKKLPTLHPFISVSRVCRKTRTPFSSHTRGAQRPQHGCLTLYVYVFLYICSRPLSQFCFGRIRLKNIYLQV